MKHLHKLNIFFSASSSDIFNAHYFIDTIVVGKDTNSNINICTAVIGFLIQCNEIRRFSSEQFTCNSLL